MASGYYGPTEYLSDGGRLSETPEFYWDQEVKRLSRDFHPPEKPALVPRVTGTDDVGTVDLTPMQKATEDADAADYADALKTGEIKPPDPKLAQQQHAAVRSFLTLTDSNSNATQTLPEEPGSEFADYDRGAYAYRLGVAHWADARKAWEALLARPAAGRHYRTVWAAFMLGRLATEQGDPSAAPWFEKTREFARQRFADSLGMAADSYGWEGRSEWKQGHPEKAAPLFLTQLALGDESAVVSLKALIPDRDDVEGVLNYDDAMTAVTSSTGFSATDLASNVLREAYEARALGSALKVMAADPLLRRLETSYILAMESGGQGFYYAPGEATGRSRRWLGVIHNAHLGAPMPDAEYLGWVAYTTGDYKDAQHWLDLSAGTTPVAAWLRSRLQLRAGDVKGAAASMAEAFAGIHDIAVYTGRHWPDEGRDPTGEDWTDSVPSPVLFVYKGMSMDFADDYTMQAWVGGDTGALLLMRNNFVQALDAFIKGGLRKDAGYVAERVLTTDELKRYADRMPPPPPAPRLDATGRAGAGFVPAADDRTWLRYVLGRRLVREGRYAEAVPYIPPPYDRMLKKYIEALNKAEDDRVSRGVRASNLSTAAWLARYDGMELMGTEVAPDGYDTDGAFSDADLAAYRLTGTLSYSDGRSDILKQQPSVSAVEMERLQDHAILPDIRYHYRIIATKLALRAAAFMNDNTEELADALNRAGRWSQDRDDKLANHCYDLIEKRCPQTKLGREVLANHWFVDEDGPWSTARKAEHAALYKQFGIPEPDQT